MAVILPVVLQKGGVGKTTTSANLAYLFAVQGLRVLVIDLDPQANLTDSLGVPLEPGHSVGPVLLGRMDVREALYEAYGCHILPAERDSLLEAERYLDAHPSSRPTERLASRVAPVLGEYDIVLVDCGPTLGMLTANALQFGDEIIVPMQCQRWSFTGLGDLLSTLREAGEGAAKIRHLIPTMVWPTPTLSDRQFLDELRQIATTLPQPVIVHEPVPRSIRMVEAQSARQPLSAYDRTTAAAAAYEQIAVAIREALGLQPRAVAARA